MGKQVLIPDSGVLVAKSIYDEVVNISASASSPVTITLPNGETYDSDELLVELRGQLLRPGIDYNFLGTLPRTQIEILRDVVNGDTIRIRKIS